MARPRRRLGDDMLDRVVILSFPMAVQAIAALEDRIAFLWRDDEAWARADCQRAVDEIRRVFGVRKMTEAELDAAHEQAMHELERWRGDPDVPEALQTYWNRGA